MVIKDKEKVIKSLVYLLRRATGISYELKDISDSMMKAILKEVDLSEPIADTLPKIRSVVNEYYTGIETALDVSLFQVAESAVAVETWLEPIKITKKLVNDSLSAVMPTSNVSTLDLIKRTKGVTLSSVRNYTMQAYEGGWTNRQFRDALRTTEKQLNRHLEMIARTSVNAVSNNAKMELYKKNSDRVDRVIFSATLDSRTSSICKALDQTAYKLKDAPKPPMHPNCLKSDTLITSSGDISNVFKRWYEGAMVEIKTRSGRTIHVTPNHPILSVNGWVAVKLLNVGDKVFGVERFVLKNNKNRVVATFSEIFSSLNVFCQSGSVKAPASAKDFHGDISHAEVDIVNTNGLSNSEIKSCVSQYVFHNRFIFGKFIHSSLNCFSSLFSFINSYFSSSYNFLKIGSVFSYLFRGFNRPFNNFLFACASDMDIVSSQGIPDGRNTITKTVSNTSNSHAPNIFRNNKGSVFKFCNGFVSFVKRNVFRNNKPFDCFAFSANNLSDRVKRHQFDGIKLDDIISVRNYVFAGHVYNLENGNNWYLSNGIITHNCRSQLVPVLKTESLDEVYEMISPRPAVVPKGKEIYDDKGLTTRTGKTRKPSVTDRSPLKGVKTGSGNYESWLRTQPKYYQEDILGKKATKSFRDGDSLIKVINIDPMTQEQLDKAIK